MFYAREGGDGIYPLNGLSDDAVKPLSAEERDSGQQRLAHQFMDEVERSLGPVGTRDDYSHLLRRLDDAEKFINVGLAHFAQKLKAETASDNGCGFQYLFLIAA
jgi:hypothetical protein